MAAPLFAAIGRGYSARTILSSIGRASPKYANAINNAYYYGYSANHILASIASRRDKKNYDADMFLTDFEKTQKRDQDRKKNQLLGTLAAAGTLGAIGAGLYSVIQKNKAIKPEVLIPEGMNKGKKGKKEPYTINRERLQIGNNQKQIANQQKQIETTQPPNQPPQPQQILPFYPPQQQAQGQPPQPQQPQGPQGQPPQRTQVPAFNPRNVDLVNNLKEDSRFRNIISAGFEPDATELALRSTMPKDIISIMDKTEGGLAQVIKDYSGYLKENPYKSALQKNTEALQRQKEQFGKQEEQIKPPQTPVEASEQVGQVQLPTNKNIQQAQQAQPLQQQQQPSQPASVQPKQTQPIAPVEQPQIQKPVENIQPEPSSRIVQAKNGKSGNLVDIKNGVATLDVNGKEERVKFSDLETAPDNVENAMRIVLNSIPEKMKSTALMGTVHIPGIDMMLTSFYDGKMAWYKNVPIDRYNKIVFSAKAPKGQAKTGIAEYNPDSADSRGSEFYDFKTDPMYSKENKDITWGYIDNKYSVFDYVQHIIHKISKERYDESGKLIVPKPRTKKSK